MGVPPLSERFERQPGVFGGVQEIRDVMDKSRNLYRFLVMLKPGFGPLVLPEGMKLGNEKEPALDQTARCFREYVGEVFNVLEHEVAYDKVGETVYQRPWFREIGGGEGHIVHTWLCPRPRHHRL